MYRFLSIPQSGPTSSSTYNTLFQYGLQRQQPGTRQAPSNMFGRKVVDGVTSTVNGQGRLCNHIFRNIAVSIIAEKNNLKVDYGYHNDIKSLGIELFSGENIYNNTIELNNSTFFSILNREKITSNLYANSDYFQTEEISNLIYRYLHNETQQVNIKRANPYNERYNTNNDCFIHIRLGDVKDKNLGLNYYLGVLDNIKFDKLYIASDTIDDLIIKEIQSKYHNNELVLLDSVKTIQFGSTCKHIVLSHGSYSAIIGYLGFDSNIYCKKYIKYVWCGNMFSISGWNLF